MIIIKFNDSRPDVYLSNISFPITIVMEDGTVYKVVKTGDKVRTIK